ncbi:MAG: hypothetical protein E7456_05420 [Ruminococcaceae bacterium]|nr:hypothetical protein [Oscillospiraceae bacterium]
MKTIKKLVVMVLVIAMTLSMFAISASAAGSIAYGAATVTASALNIRSGPDTTYSILGRVNRNCRLVILECTNDDWYKINYQGIVGYVSTDYLKDVLKAENFNATGKVTGSGCRMRSKPNTSSTILGTYNAGVKMNVIGINNGWYKVQYNGKTGYMRSDLMEIIGSSSGSSGNTGGGSNSTNSGRREEIVDFALQYEGYSYVYGGENLAEGGFDCSGFVYFVYKSNFGYSMHRTASTQYANDGRSISKSELQPGDLVFFSSNGYSVTHVGIYIGNDKFIHASTSRTGVIISSLNTSYYQRVYWGAKNVID